MVLENIRLSEIKQVVNVHSEVGRKYQMNSRPMYGLTFCRSGEINYFAAGVTTVQQRDRVLLLPKNARYKLKGIKTGDFPIINFECQSDFTDSKIQSFDIKNNDVFLFKFERLKQAFDSGQNVAKTTAMFYEIVSDIIENCNSVNVPLRPAVDCINDNFTRMTADNEELANMCGISEVYFRKLFKKTYGTSPRQYVINLRLQKAKSLLCERNRTVTEISDECGFSSVYHFCRIFKEKTGLTPSEYKKYNI